MTKNTLLAVFLIMGAFSFILTQTSNGAGHSEGQHQSALSAPERKMGGFMVNVIPLDPSKTIVSIQISTQDGRPISPTILRPSAEYVGQNIPFTPLPLEVSGTCFIANVPLKDGQAYTIQLTLVVDGTRHQQRFFISSPNSKPGVSR